MWTTSVQTIPSFDPLPSVHYNFHQIYFSSSSSYMSSTHGLLIVRILSLLSSYIHCRSKLWRWHPIITSARFHLLHSILEHILESNPKFQNAYIGKNVFGLVFRFSDTPAHALHMNLLILSYWCLSCMVYEREFIVTDLGTVKTEGKFIPVRHFMKTCGWLGVDFRWTHS
jgi:hypothetical protein